MFKLAKRNKNDRDIAHLHSIALLLDRDIRYDPYYILDCLPALNMDCITIVHVYLDNKPAEIIQDVKHIKGGDGVFNYKVKIGKLESILVHCDGGFIFKYDIEILQ